jgi:hypothetical protein
MRLNFAAEPQDTRLLVVRGLQFSVTLASHRSGLLVTFMPSRNLSDRATISSRRITAICISLNRPSLMAPTLIN